MTHAGKKINPNLDIVLCRTNDQVSECRDSKALDVGIPLLDTDIGGTSDIEVLHLSRENGILYVTPTTPPTHS